MPKLTKRFVESIEPHPEKTLIQWDSELKGLGVVVLPSGRRTYCIQYRNQHRTLKRMKLGVHGQITAEEARDLAKRNLGQIAHGQDPSEIKKENKNLVTVKDLAHDYVELHGRRKRPRSLKEDQKLLKNIILPQFGNRKVADISRKNIEGLHLRLEKTPTQANRVLALLSKMFTLAIAWEWRVDNPVKGIIRYYEEKRDTWLDDKALGRLLRVFEKYPNHPQMFAVKILLFTGARSGEIFSATWDQFDLEQGVWIKPSHLTKQKTKEYLPLAEKTLTILHELKALQKSESPYLFPDKTGEAPILNIRHFWEKIMREANIQNFRVHDLRHTYASHLVSSGLSLSIVGKLLGHKNFSTTQRYAHLADEPLRKATELFENKVEKIRLNSQEKH